MTTPIWHKLSCHTSAEISLVCPETSERGHKTGKKHHQQVVRRWLPGLASRILGSLCKLIDHLARFERPRAGTRPPFGDAELLAPRHPTPGPQTIYDPLADQLP
jgi:hypothetical protein